MSQQSEVPLRDALADYLTSVEAPERQAAEGELNRFVRWCGRDRQASSLTPSDMEEYSATLHSTGDESTHRLTITKRFLTHLHRRGAMPSDLASHAKLRRGGKGAQSAKRKPDPETPLQVTPEHYQQMEAQLTEFKAARLRVAQDIRRAAADKDVSENAPLDAAREQQGHLEARIRDLQEQLGRATILGSGQNKASAYTKVSQGSRVVLRNAESGQEITYLLVDSREADPTNGKLSVASPVGKAILDHTVDDTVEVATPRGSVSYIVAGIE